MPCYEYKCRGCGQIIDATRRLDKRQEPAECPFCGDCADFMAGISSFAFPNSNKWMFRKQVNFQTDTRDVIAKKQAALMANSGKMDNWFKKTGMSRFLRNRHEDAVAKMIKKAPPTKVAL